MASADAVISFLIGGLYLCAINGAMGERGVLSSNGEV
jgi:hypothetical protein